MTNCKNCGAPLSASQCEYCRTTYAKEPVNCARLRVPIETSPQRLIEGTERLYHQSSFWQSFSAGAANGIQAGWR